MPARWNRPVAAAPGVCREGFDLGGHRGAREAHLLGATEAARLCAHGCHGVAFRMGVTDLADMFGAGMRFV